MRCDSFNTDHLGLRLGIRGTGWFGGQSPHGVQDDQACLRGLDVLWFQAREVISRNAKIIRVRVSLSDLTRSHLRQLDMFQVQDKERQRCEQLTNTIALLNHRFGKRVVTIGPWMLPPAGVTGTTGSHFFGRCYEPISNLPQPISKLRRSTNPSVITAAPKASGVPLLPSRVRFAQDTVLLHNRGQSDLGKDRTL
jgi:DNA polymerase-4